MSQAFQSENGTEAMNRKREDSEMLYEPPQPRHKLSLAGKTSIASAQRLAMIGRIERQSGLTRKEVESKLKAGFFWCKAHGFIARPRCLVCRAAAARQKREEARNRNRSFNEVLSGLRKENPSLGALVTTADEMEQGDFSSPKQQRTPQEVR